MQQLHPQMPKVVLFVVLSSFCGYYTPSLLCIIGLALMYLQNNPGGITIFGWTVDRGLINTIFFIELTVVTFILGKTIAFTGQ